MNTGASTSQDDDKLWPLQSTHLSGVGLADSHFNDVHSEYVESWSLPASSSSNSKAASLKTSSYVSSKAGTIETAVTQNSDPLLEKGPSCSARSETPEALVKTEQDADSDNLATTTSVAELLVKGRPSVWIRLSLFIDEWTPTVLVILYFVISVSAYIILPINIVTVAWYIYLALAFFVSAAVTAEACASNRPARDARRARRRLAETAYLPNEKDIVMQQIRYALREIIYPADRYTVYLVYNTPRPIEPLQTELNALHQQYANVRVIQVKESDSKADNLNYFLEHECKTDLIGIYDTDHYAHPHGPRWAAERFCRSDGTDIVQGRCVVYNYSDSWVSRAISAEFDMIYAVFHPGRAQSHGFGLFGGANGYWRASLLKQLKMHKHMLTEDIDSTLRAFASGAKMVHELNTVSYEQAPTTVSAFYKQRMRWAQGWFQVAIRHSTLALRGVPGVKLKSRLGLFFLLVFREAFFYILTQFSSLLLGKFILQPPKTLHAVYSSLFGYPLSAWILIFNVFSLVAITTLTIRNRSEFTSPFVIIIYGLCMPLYFMILSVMGLISHARELVKYEKWNPTERASRVVPAEV